MKQLLDDDGENRAVRSFLLFYGGGNPTAAQMATHMRASGFDAVPEWVALAPGHLTKGGAQAWLRMLFDLEKPAPQPEAQALTEGEISVILDHAGRLNEPGGPGWVIQVIRQTELYLRNKLSKDPS